MNGCGAVFIQVVSSRSIGMTKPRKQQISLEATPFYHCVSRCVRRAYLCGYDRLTGRSYEHRRDQIESDILRLASVFFIDVAAYSEMNKGRVESWQSQPSLIKPCEQFSRTRLSDTLHTKACAFFQPADAGTWKIFYVDTHLKI